LLLGISGRLVSKEGALKAGGLKMNSLDYIDEVKCAGARVLGIKGPKKKRRLYIYKKETLKIIKKRKVNALNNQWVRV
jgi:hypothetical protein